MSLPRSVLRIVHWRELQHYHKPYPTWIKLYHRMLENYSLASLPDSLKWAYVGLLCLAAKTNNEIPDNPEWIRRRINLNARIDLEPLLEAGLIERVEVSSTNYRAAIEPSYQASMRPSERIYSQAEAEAEEKKEKEKEAEAESAPAPARRGTAGAAAASAHSLDTIRRFLALTKPHNAHRNGGLAVRLHRTGEDDNLIDDWLAEQRKRELAEIQREAARRDAEIASALEYGHQLIANGGPRNEHETTYLTVTLDFLQPLEAEIRAKTDTLTSFESEILSVCDQLTAFTHQPARTLVRQ